MTADPLLHWRTEFPILETTRYLISNSLGATPRATAGVRVGMSPHFYTEDAELDAAFSTIDQSRETGAWWRLDRPAIVT